MLNYLGNSSIKDLHINYEEQGIYVRLSHRVHESEGETDYRARQDYGDKVKVIAAIPA